MCYVVIHLSHVDHDEWELLIIMHHHTHHIVAFVGLELYYGITDLEDVGVVEVCSVVVYKTQCCLFIPHALDYTRDYNNAVITC